MLAESGIMVCSPAAFDAFRFAGAEVADSSRIRGAVTARRPPHSCQREYHTALSGDRQWATRRIEMCSH